MLESFIVLLGWRNRMRLRRLRKDRIGMPMAPMKVSEYKGKSNVLLRSRWISRGAVVVALLAAWCGGNGRLLAQMAPEDSTEPSRQLLGQMAPAWTAEGWVNTEPLDVKQLRGKVILLRFLNDSASSAATLNGLYRTYQARGMVVVGIYSPTPFPTQTSLDHVRELASSQGFEFAIGLDSRWETLNRYWLNRAEAELTSTTFLIDRKGIIRYIQPDGQYDKNSSNRGARREYIKLEKQIETLLKSDEVTGGATAEPKSTRSPAKPRPGETL